ncbi:tetratricopeptide repeat protein [bacterium SCSIO 12741]|nr:tetratricopeptide repeat protein [bacterium SCSIO 12741]
MKRKLSATLIILLVFLQAYALQKDIRDSVLSLQHFPSQIDQRVDTLNEWAWKSRNDEPQKGLDYANWALVLSEKHKYTKGLADAESRLGTLSLRFDRVEEALNHFRHCANLRYQQGDSLGATNVRQQIALCYRMLREFSEGMKEWVAVLTYLENHGDSLHLARAYNGYGLFQLEAKEWEMAKNYFQKGLEIAERGKFQPHLAELQTNMSNYYYYRNQLDSAIYFLELASAYWHEEGSLQKEAMHAINKGNVYQELGDLGNAERQFRIALSNYQKLELPGAQMETWFNLGRNYELKKQMDSAKSCFEQAIELAEANNLAWLIRELLPQIAEFYHQQNESEYAFELMRRYTEVRDSLFTLEKNQQKAELESEFELQKSRKDLELAAQRNAQQRKENHLMALIGASLGLLLLISGIAFWLFYQRQQTRIRLDEERLLKKDQEISLNGARAMLNGQEKERKRMASELHDSLGNLLATLRLQYDRLHDRLEKHPQMPDEVLTKMDYLLDETTSEVRRISHNMQSGVLNQFGFVKAVENLCDALESSGKIKVQLITAGWEKPLEKNLETSLFRIIQELTTNVIKHAQASFIKLTLIQKEKEVILEIKDNGKGFDQDDPESGIGLTNIRSRTQVLNGTLTLKSEPGNGVEVRLRIPLKQVKNDE